MATVQFVKLLLPGLLELEDLSSVSGPVRSDTVLPRTLDIVAQLFTRKYVAVTRIWASQNLCILCVKQLVLNIWFVLLVGLVF